MRFKFIGVSILVTILLMAYPTCVYSTVDTHTITVDDKERVTTQSGNSIDSKYMIYTTDGEVYENTDSLLFFKFNSANVYAKLSKGKTYTVKTAGWRVPFLSIQRNIIGVQ